MKRNTIIAVVLGLLVVGGAFFYFNCPLLNPREEVVEEAKLQPLRTHLQMKKWKNKACEGDTLECARVSVQFLRFSDSIRPDAARRMNDTIEILIRRSLNISELTNESFTIDQLAQQFLDDYDKENADYPSYPWNMDITTDLVYQTPKLVSIAVGFSSYMGGAHPNSEVKYHNYRTDTGKELSLEDITTDFDQLLIIAEKSFRLANDIKDNETFFDKGFEMDSLFVLTRNFAINKDGLDFLYNPYEIAPYSMGTIEFSIPYEELEGVLREEFIVGDGE